MKKPKDCQCDLCVRACNHKPGWFKPGEVEKVAAFLKITIEELFKTKLSVDWWVGRSKHIFVLSPAITTHPSGGMFSSNPRGKCVFLKNDRCEIHDVKPHECRQAMICDKDENGDHHGDTAKAWKKEQRQLKMLLGEKPYAMEFNGFNALLGGTFL